MTKYRARPINGCGENDYHFCFNRQENKDILNINRCITQQMELWFDYFDKKVNSAHPWIRIQYTKENILCKLIKVKPLLGISGDMYDFTVEFITRNNKQKGILLYSKSININRGIKEKSCYVMEDEDVIYVTDANWIDWRYNLPHFTLTNCYFDFNKNEHIPEELKPRLQYIKVDRKKLCYYVRLKNTPRAKVVYGFPEQYKITEDNKIYKVTKKDKVYKFDRANMLKE